MIWSILEARAEIEKYFRSFLVQMKTSKFAFEINWPLKKCQVWKSSFFAVSVRKNQSRFWFEWWTTFKIWVDFYAPTWQKSWLLCLRIFRFLVTWPINLKIPSWICGWPKNQWLVGQTQIHERSLGLPEMSGL